MASLFKAAAEAQRPSRSKRGRAKAVSDSPPPAPEVAALREANAACAQEVAQAEAKLSKARDELAAMRRTNERLNARLVKAAETEKQAQRALEALRQKVDKAKSLSKQAKEEVATLRREHVKDIEALKCQHQLELEELVARHWAVRQEDAARHTATFQETERRCLYTSRKLAREELAEELQQHRAALEAARHALSLCRMDRCLAETNAGHTATKLVQDVQDGVGEFLKSVRTDVERLFEGSFVEATSFYLAACEEFGHAGVVGVRIARDGSCLNEAQATQMMGAFEDLGRFKRSAVGDGAAAAAGGGGGPPPPPHLLRLEPESFVKFRPVEQELPAPEDNMFATVVAETVANNLLLLGSTAYVRALQVRTKQAFDRSAEKFARRKREWESSLDQLKTKRLMSTAGREALLAAKDAEDACSQLLKRSLEVEKPVMYAVRAAPPATN